MDRKKSYIIIMFFGVISLLGDVVYEGARGVNGQFLQLLGSSAVAVGLVAGAGELAGYLVRLLSGYYSDKLKSPWLFTIAGYALLICIPLLSSVNLWQAAALFMVMERIGKGIRSPAKDTLVSQAAKQVGTGFGFAIVELLDQIGATLGPLLFTYSFLTANVKVKTVTEYHTGYGMLWIPFLLLMAVLLTAYFIIRKDKEATGPAKPEENKLSPLFWLYSFFTLATTTGFVTFAIAGYHYKRFNVMSDARIAGFYAAAMAIDAIAGLIAGRYYDRLKSKRANNHAGMEMLIIIPILTAFIPFFLFDFEPLPVFIGVALWGIVMGTHETIMKAAIADITPMKKRGTGYGVFNSLYGIALFIGAFAAGYLYDTAIGHLKIIVVALQLIALYVFFIMRVEIRRDSHQ
jgi:MFS family permease